MILKYLGHSCFFIKADDGTSVLTDPYKSGAYGGALTYGFISDAADIAVLSHDHEDHADLSSLPNQPLQVTTDCRARGIEFDTIETFHDDVQGKERGANRVTCFTLDGIRLCHLGDLGHVPNDEQVNEIGEVDVLFVPVGGRFTVGPDEASQIVERIGPKITIPMHFKTEKCGFPIEPVDTFLKDKKEIRRSPTSEVVLSKEDLPDTSTILFLPPAN